MEHQALTAILNNIPMLLAAMDLPPELMGKVMVAAGVASQVLADLDLKALLPPESSS